MNDFELMGAIADLERKGQFREAYHMAVKAYEQHAIPAFFKVAKKLYCDVHGIDEDDLPSDWRPKAV